MGLLKSLWIWTGAYVQITSASYINASYINASYISEHLILSFSYDSFMILGALVYARNTNVGSNVQSMVFISSKYKSLNYIRWYKLFSFFLTLSGKKICNLISYERSYEISITFLNIKYVVCFPMILPIVKWSIYFGYILSNKHDYLTAKIEPMKRKFRIFFKINNW